MENLAEQLVWKADVTTLHGTIMPRSTAQSANNRTAIQIIGTPEQIRSICVAGEMGDAESARQTAAYLVLTVQLILPQWPGAQRWLKEAMPAVKKRAQKITMQGWKLTLTWIDATQTLTFEATR